MVRQSVSLRGFSVGSLERILLKDDGALDYLDGAQPSFTALLKIIVGFSFASSLRAARKNWVPFH